MEDNTITRKYSRATSNFSMTITTILTVNPTTEATDEFDATYSRQNDLQEVVVQRLQLEDSDKLPVKEFVFALVLRLNDDSGYSMSWDSCPSEWSELPRISRFDVEIWSHCCPLTSFTFLFGSILLQLSMAKLFHNTH